MKPCDECGELYSLDELEQESIGGPLLCPVCRDE